MRTHSQGEKRKKEDKTQTKRFSSDSQQSLYGSTSSSCGVRMFDSKITGWLHRHNFFVVVFCDTPTHKHQALVCGVNFLWFPAPSVKTLEVTCFDCYPRSIASKPPCCCGQHVCKG